MGLVDAPKQDLVLIEDSSDVANNRRRPENVVPFRDFNYELSMIHVKRATVGRSGELFSVDECLAVRNIVESLLNVHVDSSPIPWLKERLNPYKADRLPCYRLELDWTERKHNWRDREADVVAIPYAPPRSYLHNLPAKVYENEEPINDPDFKNPDTNLEKAFFSFLCERGFRHLIRVADYDPEYQESLTNIAQQFGDRGDHSTYLAKLMVTWAIDSAIPGVDIRRVVQHAGSIDVLCESGDNLFEVPSVGYLSQLTHDIEDKLGGIHKSLAEMATRNAENLFSDYDSSSLDVFMQSRGVIDTCRWYIENNPDLTKEELDLLNKTLSRAYTTYHTVVQTCGTYGLNSILAQAHLDISTLLAGNKVELAANDMDLAQVDIKCEEDYLGVYMAVARHDVVCANYRTAMDGSPLDWHGGARPYLGGSFEKSEEKTLRQQLTLMAILYFRMPEWQREKYNDLIRIEFARKLDKATNTSSQLYEEEFLYIPTLDLPDKLKTDYEGVFDPGIDSDIFTMQHIMPVMDLVINNPEIVKQEAPRLQMRPGKRTVIGMPGLVDVNGVFVPELSNADESEEIPEIFVNLVKKLNELASYPQDDVMAKSENIYQLEQFVRYRTSETSTGFFSFLEKRLNPPPLDTFPCLTTELPSDFVRNEWEQRADHALIPHVPPLEYLLNPPPNLWNGKQELETSIVGPHNSFIGRIICDVLQDSYSNVAELEPLFNDREKLLQIYYTWASDTRIEGREAWSVANSAHRLQTLFSKGGGSIDFEDDAFGSDLPKELYLFRPHDLMQKANTCQEELDIILNEASAHIKQSLDNIYRPNEAEVKKVFDKVNNIILVARWHLDHGVAEKMNEDVDMIMSALEVAYLARNTILQELHPPATETLINKTSHDLLALIGGYKVDSGYPGTGRDRYTPALLNDYFDAFMAVANAREVAALHQKKFNESRTEDGERQLGARAMFGTFERQKSALQQQLAMMATIYQRMPVWQRVKYRPIIEYHFDNLEKDVSASQIRRVNPEQPMFIPSASSGLEKNEYGNDVWKLGKSPRHMGNEVEYSHAEKVAWRFKLLRMQHLYPLYSSYTHLHGKPNGLQVYDYGAPVFGYGAENHWIDEQGYLHPGYEARDSKKRQRVKRSSTLVLFEEIKEREERRWLTTLAETPSITVESRLGKDLATKVKELLELSPNNGSVENLGSLAAIMEQFLGRELTEGDSSYLELLKSLGMLNREAIDISGMNEKEIRDMLTFVKTEKPKLEDMDESSLILLFLGAAGVAPRQELLEQTIKTYETTANIMALEAVEAIESISEEKKISFLEKMGLRSKENGKKSFLTRRDELRNYLALKNKENPNYLQDNDAEWLKMQHEMAEYIVDLVHSAKSYDSSADSTITSILAAKKNGKLLARCSTNAQILTTLLNLGIPGFKANLTSDYGPEGNLTLEDFLRRLLSAEDSGSASHAYSSSIKSIGDEPNQSEVIIADGESGKIRTLKPDRVKNRSCSEMKYGILADHEAGDGYGERKRVMKNCVYGGSPIAAEMALTTGQIDFAEMANPDSHMLNRTVVLRGKSFSIERRAKALRRIMQLYPYYLAMAQKNDYSRERLMNTLSSTIETGREVGNWGAAFFAANIMKNAAFLGQAANSQGAGYISLLARRIVVLSNGKYEAILKQYSEFLTSDDLGVISRVREEYLAELAALQRGGESSRKVEKDLRRKKAEEDRKEFDSRAERSKQIAKAIREEELSRQKDDEASFGVPQGKQDKEAFRKSAVEKAEEIRKETVDPDKSEFDSNRFQLLQPEVQDLLLLASVSDKDGRLLEGQDLDDRVGAMQALFVKYAYDNKVLTLGDSGTGLMKLGGNDSELVVRFEGEARKLNQRFGRAIKRVGLPIDVSNFKPRLVAEQMGRRGVQELLGRSKSKQLAG